MTSASTCCSFRREHGPASDIGIQPKTNSPGSCRAKSSWSLTMGRKCCERETAPVSKPARQMAITCRIARALLRRYWKSARVGPAKTSAAIPISTCGGDPMESRARTERRTRRRSLAGRRSAPRSRAQQQRHARHYAIARLSCRGSVEQFDSMPGDPTPPQPALCEADHEFDFLDGSEHAAKLY
jgi:hypothetical protein